MSCNAFEFQERVEKFNSDFENDYICQKEICLMQDSPRYLDWSYKTDLDIWDSFGREQTLFQTELHK